MYEGHINQILTPPFQRYEIFGAAAPFVMPRIGVRSSSIRTRTKDRIHHTDPIGVITEHTDRAGRVKFRYSDTSVVLEPRRLAGEVADNDRMDTDGIEGNLDIDTIEAVSLGLNLYWELQVKDLATKEASFTSASTLLDVGSSSTYKSPLANDKSNFRAIIASQMEVIAKEGGVQADCLLITPGLIPALENNKIFRETLRYHRLGGITKEIIAEYLTADGIDWSPDRIVIPRITYNKGDELSPSYDYVWDTSYALLFASAKPMQAIQNPFFAATLTFEGAPFVSSRRAIDFNGDIHEGTHWQREHVYAYNRASLIKGLA